MTQDIKIVASKLRRWEKYLEKYRLPAWEEIPDLGLYMDQVTALIEEYLDYLPPELKEDRFITASTINNYVRTDVMPRPVNKRYYRIHIAYLIIICTLKQTLSIALIKRVIPNGLEEEEVKKQYIAYRKSHMASAKFFMDQVRIIAAPILEHDDVDPSVAVYNAEDLIVSSAMLGGFAQLLAEKLLLLQDKTPEEVKKLEEEKELERGKGAAKEKKRSKEKAKDKK